MQATVLAEAREAYAGSRWEVAYRRFHEAAGEADLAADDLASLADAAWWLGRTDESLNLSEEVYRRCLHGDEAPAAARLALEVGFLWSLRGEATIGSGWFSRAARLLQDAPECVEHGYLRHLEILEALGGGRFERAIELARQVQELGDRHDDRTLCAVALVLEGVATVKLGRVDEGLALLDEAMLPVRAGDVARTWTGNLYCQLMGLFFELADIPRARAWTTATERWCDQHSNAAMFSGICRVHRAQLLHLDGAWQDAEQSAAQACRDLVDMNVGVVAAGHYEIGELRRLQGDFSGAEQAYSRARELGRDPQPGLALLRAWQGRAAAASAALQAALAAADQPLERAPLLAAQVEVAVATADTVRAETASRELTAIADIFGTSGWMAAARQAAGTARLLSGEAARALPLLRDACRRWHDLGARYEAATTQVRLARALEALGDPDAASRELTVAAATFSELGARHDLSALAGSSTEPGAPGGLSARELEVLGLVASGATNRAIAAELTISERTVERHLSNIFSKLDVSSRTEAARFAFLHGVGGAVED